MADPVQRRVCFTRVSWCVEHDRIDETTDMDIRGLVDFAESMRHALARIGDAGRTIEDAQDIARRARMGEYVEVDRG